MTATQNFLVDSFIAGLGLKAPCVAVAETNITLSGEQTVNGVAVVAGDRVLVTSQAFPVDNGIYLVSTGAWTRAGDFDGNRDVVTGTQVSVVNTGGSDEYYELTSPNPITIGTTEITFSLANRGFTLLYERTALEIANGITPTDLSYAPGNVFRYGAVADSALGVAGTDSATAFQSAIDSGHAVYVPEGYFSIESTLLIQSGGSLQGGKTFVMTSNTRLERFSATVNDPIIQVVGNQNYVDGNGGILAARAVGGFTEGFLLYGVNPTVTDNNDTTTGDMSYGHVNNFKIIGLSANTGWDGSVGLYVNAAARKRGLWKTGGNTCNVYYNNFEGINAQQVDFPFHVSSEASFNAFRGCAAKSWGHAAISCLGYGNTWNGTIIETPTSQDTTERFNFYLGTVNDPFTPETGTNEDPSSTIAITGISAANPAVVTTGAVHGLSSTDTILIRDIIDNGPDGDLETAINDGFWEVTVLTTTTFSISIDTSGLTNTYASGGTMQTDYLPNLGSRANQFEGSAEWAYNASSTNARLMGYSEPVGSYSSGFDGVYGNNILRISGTHPGGAGIDGFSSRAGIRNNLIYSQSLRVNRTIVENHHGFSFRTLDDESAGYFGGDRSAQFEDLFEAVENTAYTVLTHDNIGATSGCVLFKLTYLMREEANSDHEGGEISWLCPVASATAQTAVKYKEFVATYNGAGQPYVTWSVAGGAGTKANTAKFTLTATTDASIPGTEDLEVLWKLEVLANYGVSLDFDGDITVQNGT